MERMITFRRLKKLCENRTNRGDYCYLLIDVCENDKCTANNCPVWRKLKVIK